MGGVRCRRGRKGRMFLVDWTTVYILSGCRVKEGRRGQHFQNHNYDYNFKSSSNL